MVLEHTPHTKQYDDYMNSPEWLALADQRRKFDNWRCGVCGRPHMFCKEGLQVHHLSYQNLGHEDIEHDIISLCGKCHKKIHLNDPYTVEKAYARNDLKVVNHPNGTVSYERL